MATINLFDVSVKVTNETGNLLFVYYPKAGVIEVKRNKIFAQITVAGLLEQGTRAMALANAALEVSLPERIRLYAEVDTK